MQDCALYFLIAAAVFLVILIIVVFYFLAKAARQRQEIEKLQTQSTHAEELHSQELQHHEDIIHEKQNELNSLSRELETLENNHSALQMAHSQMRAKLEVIDNQIEMVRAQNRQLESRSEKLSESRTRLESENQHLLARMTEFRNEQESLRLQMRNEFKVLAEEITRKTSQDLAHESKEKLSNLLDPFKEKLDGLRQKVETTYTQDKAERISLKDQIQQLAQMNEKLSHEADALVHALKGSTKTQGNWGEMILESILEQSGLLKGQHYEREVTLRDEEGNALLQEGKRMRPDVLVKYPDGRTIIIDSKVSLLAYVEFSEADDKDLQQQALDKHVLSIKNHIQNLSVKKYEQYVRAPDFVLMFIPIEPAFHFALQHDQGLWQYAWDRKIILISPTTLIATLRLVSEVWSRDKQSRNAIDIADRAGALYDKFALFYESLQDIGKHLDKAQSSLHQSKNRLSDGAGSVLSHVEKLKKLGAKAKKALPTGEDS